MRVTISERILHDTNRARAHRRSYGPPGDPLAHPNAVHPRHSLATPLESVLSAVVVLCRCREQQQLVVRAMQGICTVISD